MDLSQLLQAVVGPWGATILLVIATVVLWRKLEATQAIAAKQQEIFDKALDLIRDDLVPLVKELSKR